MAAILKDFKTRLENALGKAPGVILNTLTPSSTYRKTKGQALSLIHISEPTRPY